MLDKQLICVTGLPREGSTLLCQLLDTHPKIYSPGHSSPLCPTLNQLRHNLSDNEFLLAQLDNNFDLVYQRLLNAFRGFISGWFAETNQPLVADKNRGWLMQLDMVHLLDPNCRMLVCVRELGQIIGSVEARHQQTLLLDFPDHLATLSRYSRADKLLANDGVIGAPLRTIEAMQDMPKNLQQRVFYVIFEHLMQEPAVVLKDIFSWLKVEPSQIDWKNLPVKPHESDSHYRFKYSHATRAALQPPARHQISSRIEQEIIKQFGWFYKTFYPATLPSNP
ncbi:MAG: sulfotransferase [Candidatus Electrothrix sp. GM3_4]|nr:sulfotransferase [Candidatus Electrothrix sp. GM3_4]